MHVRNCCCIIECMHVQACCAATLIREYVSTDEGMLTVVMRERCLIEVLRTGGITHRVAALPVGDVLCEYDDRTSWLAERKRTADLANGIKSGRWSEQVSRLVEVGSPIFIFEGDLRNVCLPYKSMIGGSC